MHRSQVVFALLDSFLLGVFGASFFAPGLQVLLGGIILGTLVVVVAAYRGTFGEAVRGTQLRVRGVLFGVGIISAILGMYRFSSFDTQRSVLKEFADRQVQGKPIQIVVRGYVDEDVRSSENRVVMRVKEIVGKKSLFTDERLLIVSDVAGMFPFGHPIEVTTSIESPKNFDTFDYVTYLRKQGVRFVGSAVKVEATDLVRLSFSESFRLPLYQKIFQIKHAFERSLNQALSQPYAAFINGILLGTRDQIPDSLRDAFSVTGTSHVLAISGYNISILAGSTVEILLLFMRRRRAFWFSVLIVILFTILTGASASVVRAAVMGVLLLAAQSSGRLYDGLYAVVLAAGLMVWANPLILRFDIGFQLSFLAVLGLMYLYPRFQVYTKTWRAWSWLKETILMTCAAQIMVLPLLLYYFKNFSVVSLPANVLIVPFIPFAMFFGFWTGIAGLVWVGFGKLLGVITWGIAWYQLGVVRFLSQVPFAAVQFEHISLLVPIMLYGGILYFLWYTRSYET